MAVLKDLIVHGPSRFINTAQFEALKANRIGAEEGVFNKLIATNADIGTLDVDDLTAQNATVVGLLDVKGEMHTNSWTNANIANIGGSFYIAPTIIPTDGTTTISITKNSATSWTVVLTGTFATDFIKTGTNTTGQNWPANSLVLVTGNITVKNMKYPLGTLKGTLSAAVTASAASTSKTVTITGVTDGQGHTTPAVLDELWTLNGANISNAVFSDGKISLYKMGSYPIGIQMSSMGTNANSMIEIYGGVAANPTVRIGHLAGLPTINGTSPTGWGIYTDNGYFSGVIVSHSGKIGGFTIGSTDLYNGTLGAANSVWMSIGTSGSANIGGSGSIANWAFTAGNTYGVTKSGALYATSGKIGGWTIGTNDLSTGTVGNQSGIKIANTDFSGNIAGASRSNLRLAIGSGFGVNRDGVLYATGAKIAGDVTVSKLTVDSGATISDTNGLISNSAIKIGGRNFVRNSQTMDDWIKGSNVTITNDEYSYATLVGTNSNWNSRLEFRPTQSLAFLDGQENVISFEYKATANWTTNESAFVLAGTAAEVGTITDASRTKYMTLCEAVTLPACSEWTKASVPCKALSVSDLTSGSGDVNSWYLQCYLHKNDITVDIRKIKLEKGNKATDWTPAPEDVDANIEDVAVDAAESLASTSESIHQRINGTDDEVATIKANLAKAAARTDLNAIDAFVKKYLGDNGYVKINNQGLVITQGQFSVVITGDRMIFQENGNSVAYLTNQKLFITKAEVTQEMKIANFVWTNRDGRLTLMLT